MKMLFLMCLVLITTTALGHNETNSVLTCYNARVPDIKFTANSQFCNFVTWPAARLYDQSTFTYYDAGTPLSYQDHFDYAISLYVSYLRTIVGMNEEVAKEMIAGESSSCTEATQRLACTSAFPECPYGGSSAASVTTLPPCRLQCEQVNAMCSEMNGNMKALDCINYQTENCIVYIPVGYFVLPPSLGPYGGLASMFAVFLLTWLFLTAWWIHLAYFKLRKQCLKICRAVAIVPVIKCATLLFVLSFWVTCDLWIMCSSPIAVVVINSQLVYESSLIWFYLCVAEGWDNISADRAEYADGAATRRVTLWTLLFYVGVSILQVAKEANLTQAQYAVGIILLYISMYLIIMKRTYMHVKILKKQVGRLERETVPATYVDPMKHKLLTHTTFLSLVTISLGMEMLLHVMWSTQVGYAALLLVYECLGLAIVMTIMYVVRPQEYSPFFFMVPMDRLEAINDGQLSTVGNVDVFLEQDQEQSEASELDHAERTATVELKPLIARRHESGSSMKMVMVHKSGSFVLGFDEDLPVPPKSARSS